MIAESVNEARQVSLRKLSESVKKACNEPELRKYLDDKKRLPKERLLKLINGANSKWTLTNGLIGYVSLVKRNIKATCKAGHERDVSINDVIHDVACRTCTPKLRTMSGNASFKPFRVFMSELLEKRGADSFEFDIGTYAGISRPMSIRCTTCSTEFQKPPKQLIYEKIGCPRCANKAKGDSQRRTWEKFLSAAKTAHGDAFTYHKNADNCYGNNNLINRSCNTCCTIEKQSIQSHISGNGCKTCSKTRKHTNESFIELSKTIWGQERFDYSNVSYVNNKVPVTLTCDKGHKFQVSPSNHFNRRGCPMCSAKNFVSVGETEWLDSLNIPHSCRNVWVNVNDQRFNVDALINSTVYEYYGDFWHGNPNRFDPNQINVYSGMTMAELYDHTLAREQLLREASYVIISMWESQWITLRKTRPAHKHQ